MALAVLSLSLSLSLSHTHTHTRENYGEKVESKRACIFFSKKILISKNVLAIFESYLFLQNQFYEHILNIIRLFTKVLSFLKFDKQKL
jgi:hypothetical protein